MTGMERTYVPAAGHDWALPLYDPLVKLMGGDATRRVLTEQAPIRPGERVLEIGCGTGSLTLAIKRAHPDADVVGLDPDPKALARARRKAKQAGLSVRWDAGFADDLPYPDASFHRIFSSLMFHHLQSGEKEATLREARRVLRPGGSFHLLDFAGPDGADANWLLRRLHAHPSLKDNSDARIFEFLERAGFADVRKAGERTMLLWKVGYFQAWAPDPAMDGVLRRPLTAEKLAT